MSNSILTMVVRLEHDVVLARQRARRIAGLLGFDAHDQTRIATAVSEIVRNAFEYGHGGRVEFLADQGTPVSLVIRVRDQGPGIRDLPAILEGRYRSATGMGLGIVGAKRLMDGFRIESQVGVGTTVELIRHLPRRLTGSGPLDFNRIADELARSGPENPLQEVQLQNQELLRTLEDLHARQAELERLNLELRDHQDRLSQLNRELEDTNRGVVALYAELDEKADFLRRASETKSRFLSNMSHEFRTPLNAITGLSRLLLDRTDGDLTDEQEKQAKLIHHSAEGLTEIVNDLLDLARVEAGKVTVRPAEFEIATMFAALRGMLRPFLTHNSALDLVFESPDGLPPFNTDESKVSQILRNFISNALKFTEQGVVRVSAAAGEDDTVVLTVADTGVGIAPEDQERIFDEFTQIDSPRQRMVKGTGLGLPLVKKLAALLGGNVRVSSTPGVGSTFAVSLPRVYSGPTEMTYAPEVSSKIDPRRNPVLVVEDNVETLFIYEKYLKGSIFQIIPARTIAAAQAALREFRPIAVVLDVLLERESTWEFLAELKRSESTREIPVFVATLVENQHKALALGANDYCVKPIERSWLLERLGESTTFSQSTNKVLVIDDDEASRYLLKGMLAPRRLQYREAATGSEGLRIARLERPQAIFLDLDLPDMSGLDVLEDLKRDARTRDTRVMIHTARQLTETDRRRITSAGVVAIVAKGSSTHDDIRLHMDAALRAAGLWTAGPASVPGDAP